MCWNPDALFDNETSDQTLLCLKLYDEMRQVAAQGGTVTCAELGARVGLPQDSLEGRAEFCRMVDAINLHLHLCGQPMLSAVVLARDNGRPSWRFFEQARRLGLYREGTDHQAFFQEELNKVYKCWSNAQGG